MAHRNPIITAVARLLPLLGCGVFIVGCAASEPQRTDSTPPAGPVRPVLVLPSSTMLELACETRTSVGMDPGRRDRNLGGRPLNSSGPGISVIEIRDDQRVINGRVQSQTRWRTRSGDVRGRLR
ncbi:MAG: hypothetical protein CMJ34_03690 [Phycisphaerae bacterium]|nr:hypothetical protein [Phycisphaerae bacterium]